MFVINKSHDGCILTEYNGKKYCFYKDIPVEISPEIYNNILMSGHISAQEVVICEEPKVVEKPKETIIEKVVRVVKPIHKLKDKRKK